MAKASHITPFGKTLVVSRRQLLASTAVVTAAAIVPSLEQAEAANPSKAVDLNEAQQLEVSGWNVSAVTALRLREIAERNRLRQEVGLPLLSVIKELRRMKESAESERFRKFADEHRTRVYDKMLCRVRRQCGDPNWAPTGMLSGGGWRFAMQVDEQTRKLYRRMSGVAGSRRPRELGIELTGSARVTTHLQSGPGVAFSMLGLTGVTRS